MNLGKNVMMIVSLMVAVIIALAVLVPVIQDTSASEDTLTNEGYFRMSEITEDTDVTIVWDSSKPTTITVDGVEIIPNVPVNKTVSIVGSDTMIVRYVTAGGNNNRVQSYSSAGFIQSALPDGTMTITINGFTITADNGTTTKTMTATQGYYIDPNGESIMKDADKPAYVHKDSSIMVLAGITNISGSGDTGVYGAGTINDGLEFTYVPTSASTPTVTFGDVTFNYSEVSSYVDLVSLNNCTFDITNNGNTGNANYSYFIVPYEVTAERSVHVSTVEASLLGIIPLLVVIGIVIGAVWFIRQKN